MTLSSFLVAYSSYSTQPPATRSRVGKRSRIEPPEKPDWLLIMVVVLFLITLFVAWLVDIPLPE